MEEVKGSIPFSSTLSAAGRASAPFLGGVVAGEGYFSVIRRRERFPDGSPRLRFRFGVEMAARDRGILAALHEALGCGRIRCRTRAGWLETCDLTVDRSADLHQRVIPFIDRYLLPSAKRVQFERWREDLVRYEQHRPTRHGLGPSPCSVQGCERPVRGRGLCRVHYYRATGY